MATLLSAGIPALPDSAEAPPPISPAAALAAVVAKGGSPNMDQEFLLKLGMTKRMSKRIMADGKSQRYLNTKVTAQVLLVAQANSIDEIMKTQRVAAKMGKNTDIDFRTRCGCLAVVPQCGMALARLSEVAISTARNLDQPEDNGEQRVVAPTQNNFFGFPPVATSRPNRGSAIARIGDSPTPDIEVEANSET